MRVSHIPRKDFPEVIGGGRFVSMLSFLLLVYLLFRWGIWLIEETEQEDSYYYRREKYSGWDLAEAGKAGAFIRRLL